jgi:hypothetical protein
MKVVFTRYKGQVDIYFFAVVTQINTFSPFGDDFLDGWILNMVLEIVVKDRIDYIWAF